MYDTIIIGSGPAGISAAIYAARRAMKVLLVGKNLGGQVIWATEIENYPGFKNISSLELIQRWEEHLQANNIETKNEEVVDIKKKDDNFLVITQNGENKEYLTKTIIVTMGLSHRLLNVPGEKEFSGRGVSYCANCDGPFFKNKTVAVVGGGNCALDAAEVMAKIASQVYLITHDEKLSGFENLVSEIKSKENIKVIYKSSIREIKGDNKVRAIVLLDNDNNEKEIKVDGIFVEIGRIAKTEIVNKMLNVDNQNQIIIDAECKTNVPGIFAAGDVTNVPFKQITIASGQGTIAALSAYKYIQLKT
jgi:NADH-dependent peroxiredoxin subunit F